MSNEIPLPTRPDPGLSESKRAKPIPQRGESVDAATPPTAPSIEDAFAAWWLDSDGYGYDTLQDILRFAFHSGAGWAARTPTPAAGPNVEAVAGVLTALGSAYRGDWSDFDGRSLRLSLDGIASRLAPDAEPATYEELCRAEEICPIERCWYQHCSKRIDYSSCEHIAGSVREAATPEPASPNIDGLVRDALRKSGDYTEEAIEEIIEWAHERGRQMRAERETEEAAPPEPPKDAKNE